MQAKKKIYRPLLPEEQDYVSQYHGRRPKAQHRKRLAQIRATKECYEPQSMADIIHSRNNNVDKFLRAFAVILPAVTVVVAIVVLLGR